MVEGLDSKPNQLTFKLMAIQTGTFAGTPGVNGPKSPEINSLRSRLNLGVIFISSSSAKNSTSAGLIDPILINKI